MELWDLATPENAALGLVVFLMILVALWVWTRR
jgi:hypothetical protein